jgi:hypothetical protein
MKYLYGCLVCCVFLNLSVGCGDSSGGNSEKITWKNKFPMLWSIAYADDIDVNPEDVTYSEFIQAVKNELKNDQGFINLLLDDQDFVGELIDAFKNNDDYMDEIAGNLSNNDVLIQSGKNELENDQDFIDLINVSGQITSWNHIIIENDITYQDWYQSTITINDNRIQKNCGVDVYIVGDTQNMSLNSINSNYELIVEDGSISITIILNGNVYGITNPPIGEELIIFLTYND